MSKTDEIASRIRRDCVAYADSLASVVAKELRAILDERDELRAENKALRAAVELAKEALDPWAAQADEIDKHLSEWPLTRPINIEGSFLPAFRRDFQKARRARAALEGK